MTKQLDLYDLRRREVQALGAALSCRDWYMMEKAYNSLRDKLDNAGFTVSGPPATSKPPAVGDAGAVRWRERWYGSDPQRGSAIVDEAGNLIAYFGGDEKTHDATTAAVAAHNAALALPAPVVEGERWRHVKRGTVYEVIGYAELQNGNAKGLREGAELAIYRGEDGKLWARERGEFHDGRFAALSEGRTDA